MGFFTKIFKRRTPSLFPATDFGRFSDAYKTDEEFDVWDQAIAAYEKGKFVQSVLHFLNFLAIPGKKNVEFQQEKGEVHFRIWQGSKMISATADRKGIRAISPIVQVEKSSLGLMRYLLEVNYELKFARYAMDEKNTVCLVFDSAAADAPPHKLYQALKEVAMEGDRKDEFLLSRFEGLAPVQHEAMDPLTHEIKKEKLTFVKQWADAVLHELSHGRLNTHIYPGGASFLLLDFLYRMDMLIQPEGEWKEQIRECHEHYFSESPREVFEKNKKLADLATKMAHQKGLNLEACLYHAPFTFGQAQPEGHRQFIEVYDSQMGEFEWYYENHYEIFARAICGYVAGHCLYQFALPEPTRDLLLLFYRLTVPVFFGSMGYEDIYLASVTDGRKVVGDEVRRIIEGYAGQYGIVKIDVNQIRFDDVAIFSVSYLGMVRNLEYRDY